MIDLLEDDGNIRRLVDYALTREGYEVRGFASPQEFWEGLKQGLPQLLLLDIMLPGEDGLSILKKLRSRSDTRRLPVILLTARDSEFDKVTGLDLGADDYVAKPFGMMELISRIRAVLRRTEGESAGAEYRRGGLYVQPEKHIVQVDGQPVTLTYKEYELLCALLEADGRVLTRDTLLSTIWGYDFDGDTRTVDVHIRRLRQKLGEAGGCIETVKGIGYKIGG
ncbi:MAG: response regulator transcription factor [Clostridiales bacterium]|nr:response regulator transcription factor [Clostridiales bacterium]